MYCFPMSPFGLVDEPRLMFRTNLLVDLFSLGDFFPIVDHLIFSRKFSFIHLEIIHSYTCDYLKI